MQFKLFLEKLNNLDQGLREAAKETYSITLSKYHTLTVRSAVTLAFYTLPSRESFLKSVNLDPNEESLFDNLVHSIHSLRNVMMEFYEKYDLSNI